MRSNAAGYSTTSAFFVLVRPRRLVERSLDRKMWNRGDNRAQDEKRMNDELFKTIEVFRRRAEKERKRMQQQEDGRKRQEERRQRKFEKVAFRG
jgi:hypothetical protein